MMERRDRTPNARQFLPMLALIVLAPLCLGLLLVAARHDTARSGMGGAVPDVGPDWAVVQEYLDRQNAWGQRTRGIGRAGLSPEERDRRFQEAFAERPDIRPAIAAATAIVDAGGAHDKTTEAAEFLVLQTFGEPDADRHMSKGAQVLVAREPYDEHWPSILMRMDGRRRFYRPDGGSSARGIDRFFEETASGAESPVLRATGRY